MNLIRALHLAVDCLLPQHCLVCTKPLKGGVKVCRKCFPTKISGHNQTDFTRIRYLWHYDGAARDYIHQMKYKPDPYLCVLAGRQLGEACKELYPGESWDLVIPIPSSPNTLRQRRFNQCSILAQELTKTFPPRSFAPRILKYLGSGIPQASLPQEKRIRNMSNAFGVSEDVTAKAILLIDDVITTGATSGSASAVLLGAGARRVDILSLAQAESWYSYQDRVQNAFFR